MKAFAYSRVSTSRQELSPEAQRAELQAYALLKTYELLPLPDEKCSGRIEFSKRPVGAEVMRRIDEVGAVIFTKLDRGFRNTVDCLLTVAELCEKKKAVHILDLGVDTTTSVGELVVTIMAGLAKFERRRIGERISEALEMVAHEGRALGTPPYGYRATATVGTDGKKRRAGIYEPIADEQEIIREIITRHDDGWSAHRIAMRLTYLKKPTPRKAKKWSTQTVLNILERELEIVS